MAAGCRSVGGPASRPVAIDSLLIYNVSMSKRIMQEATFLILTALADGSQHGYGIIGDVAAISEGRVTLRAGTLYTALDREEIVDGRLRRYYRLTPDGARRLAVEAARLRSNATAALSRLSQAEVTT